MCEGFMDSVPSSIHALRMRGPSLLLPLSHINKALTSHDPFIANTLRIFTSPLLFNLLHPPLLSETFTTSGKFHTQLLSHTDFCYLHHPHKGCLASLRRSEI